MKLQYILWSTKTTTSQFSKCFLLFDNLWFFTPADKSEIYVTRVQSEDEDWRRHYFGHVLHKIGLTTAVQNLSLVSLVGLSSVLAHFQAK